MQRGHARAPTVSRQLAHSATVRFIVAAIFLSRAVLATECGTTRELTAAVRAQYREDGFVIVRGMYTASEVAILQETIETDPLISANVMPMVDGTGAVSKGTWGRSVDLFEIQLG